MPTADEAYLEQVRKLVLKAEESLQEAKIYLGLIFDETLRNQARRIMEDFNFPLEG